jgi:hypothetical protein
MMCILMILLMVPIKFLLGKTILVIKNVPNQFGRLDIV